MWVSDAANVRFTAAGETSYTLKVLDITGRVVSHTAGIAAAGENKLTVDFSWYKAGMYMVMLRNGEGVKTVKVVRE